MGNNNTSLANLLTNYDLAAKNYDNSFGNVAVYQRKAFPSSLVCIKTIEFQDENHLNHYTKSFQDAILVESNNLLQFYTYEIDGNTIHILVEFLYSDLKQEIIQRQQDKNLFNESELQKILLQSLKGLVDLQKSGTYHGNIKPSTILLNKEGLIKLFDNGILFPYKQENCKSHKFDLDSLPSPELLSNLTTQKQFDFNRSDIYSLGLTILSAGLLNLNLNIYNNNSVKIESLDQYLYKFHSLFPNLYTILSQMLEYNYEIRVTGQNLIEEINNISFQNPPQRSRFTSSIFMDYPQQKENQTTVSSFEIFSQIQPLQSSIRTQSNLTTTYSINTLKVKPHPQIYSVFSDFKQNNTNTSYKQKSAEKRVTNIENLPEDTIESRVSKALKMSKETINKNNILNRII